VPTDERTAKGTDRCETHPGAPSVARCDRCDRALCVSCAVPVRGRILGPECLAEALGPDAPVRPLPPALERPGMGLVGIAFAAAVLVTLLPWTRFGHASGPLDAWRWARWSLVAAIAAAVGLLLWAVQWWRPRIVDHAAAVGLGCLGGIVAAAGVLAALFPPSLTKGTLVPWLEAFAGLAAAAAAIRAAGAGRSSG
jgi:hypothetical protein